MVRNWWVVLLYPTWVTIISRMGPEVCFENGSPTAGTQTDGFLTGFSAKPNGSAPSHPIHECLPTGKVW